MWQGEARSDEPWCLWDHDARRFFVWLSQCGNGRSGGAPACVPTVGSLGDYIKEAIDGAVDALGRLVRPGDDLSPDGSCSSDPKGRSLRCSGQRFRELGHFNDVRGRAIGRSCGSGCCGGGANGAHRKRVANVDDHSPRPRAKSRGDLDSSATARSFNP